jgi:hypothetical protein
LSASDNVIVAKTYNIPQGLPKAEFGCMPYDNGHLLLSESEKNSLLEKYPESDIFIKRIMGSQEFLNDIRRYCLWIDGIKNDKNNKDYGRKSNIGGGASGLEL